MEVMPTPTRHQILSWIVEYAAKFGMYEIIQGCEKVMDGTLTDPKIAQRLRLAMFRRVSEDRQFIRDFIFTDAVELYEKAVPKEQDRAYDSPYFYNLVEMKIQAMMTSKDNLPLFTKKAKSLFDYKSRTGEEKRVFKDAIRSLVEFHKEKLEGKRKKSNGYRKFLELHRWSDYCTGMTGYLRGLGDDLGDTYLEQLENRKGFKFKRAIASRIPADHKEVEMELREEQELHDDNELPDTQLDDDESFEEPIQIKKQSKWKLPHTQLDREKAFKHTRQLKKPARKRGKAEAEFRIPDGYPDELDDDFSDENNAGNSSPEEMLGWGREQTATKRKKKMLRKGTKTKAKKGKAIIVENVLFPMSGDGDDEIEDYGEENENKGNNAAGRLNLKRRKLNSKIKDPLGDVIEASNKSKKREEGEPNALSRYDIEHPDAKSVEWSSVKSDNEVLQSPKYSKFGGKLRSGKDVKLKFQRKRKKNPWSLREENDLKKAVERFGKKWSKIKSCGEFDFSKRTQVQLKDKWRQILKQLHAPS